MLNEKEKRYFASFLTYADRKNYERRAANLKEVVYSNNKLTLAEKQKYYNDLIEYELCYNTQESVFAIGGALEEKLNVEKDPQERERLKSEMAKYIQCKDILTSYAKELSDAYDRAAAKVGLNEKKELKQATGFRTR